MEELGLEGTKENIIINVGNCQRDNLMSATTEIGLESLGGRVDTIIVAKTSNNIFGGMKPTNWLQIKDQWKHFRDIPFPKLGKRSKIDVFIGSDYYNLLFPMEEVPMEEVRLHTVEKKLMHDEKLAQVYQSVVKDYLSEGYIREVSEDEPKPPSEWFHVIRPQPKFGFFSTLRITTGS